MEIQADWGQIRRMIDNAPWRQKGAIVARLAARFGCSAATIYRKLRAAAGAKRERAGGYKIDPQNELIDMVGELKTIGKMGHLKPREVKTDWCIEQLQRMGLAGAEKLTASTVNRRLVEAGFREPQPTVRLEAAYANQVHMIDFSRSKYFQLFDYDAHTNDYMLVASGKELHYKKDDARLRTWMVQYMDDYSRLRKVRAYAETNESAFLGLDHIQRVWTPSDDHPMHYLPLEMLRSDNGAFRKSKETIAAMDALDVTLTKQRPGHKGGTAKVENRFRSLWQEFELPLYIQLGAGGRIWLSDFNDLLAEFCAKEQHKQHPYEKTVTRGERYQRSLADRSVTQRTTEADIIRLACRVEKRTVDGHLRVSLDNVYYSVPQYVGGIPTMGKQVYVHKNKYGELSGKLIDDLATASFELAEWTPVHWGDYGSIVKTAQTKREDAFETDMPSYQEVMGGGSKQEADVKPTYAKASADRRETAQVRYMKPETEQVEPDSPFNEKMAATGRLFSSELDAREYIGIRVEAWGMMFGDVAHYFDDAFEAAVGSGRLQWAVSQRDLDAIIETIGTDFDSGKLAVNY